MLHGEEFFEEYIRTRDYIWREIEKTQVDGRIDPTRRIPTVLLEFLRDSANTIQIVVATYTRDPKCHVAIKTFNRGTEKVTTYARDYFAPRRKDRDEDPGQRSQPYWKNTAFQKILEDPAYSFYYSNWLAFQSFIGRYRSGHSGWQKTYRAAIIVPITSKRNETTISSQTVWGFICIDNKQGRFNKYDCTSLLFMFSRAYSDLFSMVSRISQDADMPEWLSTTAEEPKEKGV
jgi:hypothetical protein